ncbi:hypothetical protein ABXT64_00965 [Candidatus Marifrigoribacter sp. Uisw_064]|uniref:hypothetical protein n=1 Tax=Candidatus Marifrigoribacter sp. Uisw_064 TaxID=3230970 RepID=UPI003D4C80DD
MKWITKVKVVALIACYKPLEKIQQLNYIMELNETKLHELLGQVVTEMGAAANGPLITNRQWRIYKIKKTTETPFNLILEART